MRKISRFILVNVVLAFIVIQFFQPLKNKSKDTSGHIFQHAQVPESIKNTLTEACLDCHSNNTRYSWYHNIAPVSWMVNKHIIEGKEHLNFSNWDKRDVFDKITVLEEICQETERHTMPLKSYRIIHPKAKLNDEQIAELCAFTTRLSEELLASAIEN